MVTPEMLLFLAERMGMKAGIHGPRVAIWNDNGWTMIWAPHEADNQFGRLVVWAAIQGLEPMLSKRHAFAGLAVTSSDYTEGHNSTPDSIRAATVVAICRALGYQEDAK